MIEQLQFYIRHSWNDLRVNGQRTLFAILAIAAGVAAIVSLQTLAVLITDTLTDNLQQQNRGDIQIQPPFFIPEDDAEEFEDSPFVDAETQAEIQQRNEQAEQAAEDGLLAERTTNFFGESNDIGFSQAGVDAIQATLNERFPGAETTYRVSLAGFGQVFLGNGPGVVMDAIENGNQVIRLSPIVVDTDVYPFFDEVNVLDGTPLAQVIQSPTDIVISELVADTLAVQVGDEVRLSGSAETFTVAGIVRAEEEITSAFGSNPFIGLFGFYYLDQEAMPLFEDVTPLIDTVYVRLPENAEVTQATNALRDAFTFANFTDTEDLLEQNQQIADALDTLVTAMGLLSLLIGSIGIVNTMQVIVRRRTTEIAVLKTLGLQANQVTVLFLTEAFIMGILGSIVGIVLGWVATFALKGVADVFTGRELVFRIAPEPAINGFIVGVVVTTVFGFLPTLTAGQVRPGAVLRPSNEIRLRAGFLRSLVALFIVIVVVSLIAQSFLGGNLGTAFQLVGGAFLAAGVLFVLLLFLIWIIGRILPSFGVVDLKLSLRQMLVTRGRGAITLLALVVGVFALSLITMFTQTFTNLLDFAVEESAPGNVLVQALPTSQGLLNTQLERLQAEGVIDSIVVQRQYDVTVNTLVDGETGEEITATVTEGDEQIPVSPINLTSLEAWTADQIDTDAELVAGRQLTPEDAGQPVIVVSANGTNIAPGDSVVLSLQGGGLLGREAEVTFEVVGVLADTSDSVNFSFGLPADAYVMFESVPENIQPTSTTTFLNVTDDNIGELRRQVNAIPGAFLLELNLLSDLVRLLVAQFQAFPTLVAALGLAVGGVVIANSVALATIERRREIAVMKALGLQRERVLGMLLLENGLLGFIGGLIGVGIGLVGLVLLSGAAGIPTDTVPFGTALLLMGLCILVALIAALTTAWGASGEKPLNVLRYE
ncbi:MAG: hypothetical protein OHK0046_03190 [Anaerolineae bacterium]